ncbi:hypothetical protein SAMN04490193_1696 [Pseudomonas marginalis]|nr:hypothetical protein SAMN04490193_1696 [Pseudomonas marginalis]
MILAHRDLGAESSLGANYSVRKPRSDESLYLGWAEEGKEGDDSVSRNGREGSPPETPRFGVRDCARTIRSCELEQFRCRLLEKLNRLIYMYAAGATLFEQTLGFPCREQEKSPRLIKGRDVCLTVAAGGDVCGCQRGFKRGCAPGALPMESTMLALEDAFSSAIARRILALHPAPFLESGRRPDIQ